MRLAIFVSIVLYLTSSAWADVVSKFGVADVVWDARISPGGTHLALGCSPTGRMAVCVYDLQAGGQPKLLKPDSEQRLLNFFWASDDHLVSIVSFFERVNTSNGLRSIEVHRALSYSVSNYRSRMLMREARGYDRLTSFNALCDLKPDTVLMELTVLPDSRPQLGSLTSLGPGFVTLLYDVNLNTGRMELLETSQRDGVGYVIGPDCEPHAEVKYDIDGERFWLEVSDTGREIVSFDDVTTGYPISVSGLTPDRSGFVVAAEHGDYQGFYELNLESGDLTPLQLDGIPGGRFSLIKHRLSDRVIGLQYTDDLPGSIYLDSDIAQLQGMLAESLPGQRLRFLSMSRDQSKFTFESMAAGRPARYFLIDLAAGQVQPLGTQVEGLDEESLAVAQREDFQSRDGLTIPTYVTLPQGKTQEEGPFPTIILPHGGPESRDDARYDWWVSALSQSGYAVIQPNFRGSSGYGQAFRDAGYGEFGGKMIADIADSVDWALAEMIADPAGVCVAGASYGGYAALMVSLEKPDEIGCTIAVAPVTDPFAFMARLRGSGGMAQNYWERYIGSDRFASDDVRANLSPAKRINAFRGPILLMHGRSDLVVPFEQSRNFVRAWGNQSGLDWRPLENQDHYLTSTEARQAVLRATIDFLASNHPVYVQ